MPDLLAYCYFYKNDSAIDHLLYEWDKSNMPGTQEDTRLPISQVLNLRKQYNDLVALISASFGKAETKGSIEDTSQLAQGGLSRDDKWQPNDSTALATYTNLSSKYEHAGAVTTATTYRIRLYVMNIRAAASPPSSPAAAPLNETVIRSLDSVAQAFFASMAAKDFDKARTCLSASIVQSASNERLEQLSKAISFGEKIDIWMTGVQLSMDGTRYVVVQYKYASDKNAPPKDIIKITFDDTNKIKGAHASTMKRIQ
jgi:hypothetical protein